MATAGAQRNIDRLIVHNPIGQRAQLRFAQRLPESLKGIPLIEEISYIVRSQEPIERGMNKRQPSQGDRWHGFGQAIERPDIDPEIEIVCPDVVGLIRQELTPGQQLIASCWRKVGHTMGFWLTGKGSGLVKRQIVSTDPTGRTALRNPVPAFLAGTKEIGMVVEDGHEHSTSSSLSISIRHGGSVRF
jgi:hypothetical protein